MNDGGWLMPALVAGGIFLVLGLILGICYHFENKWRLQWLEVAAALGFEPLPVYPEELNGIVESSRLMTTGRQRVRTNVFVKKAASLDVAVCDYRHTVGQGKKATVWHQTVILFCSPAINAPQFEIKPEGWMSKLGEMLGGHDIDFAESPEFSKKYVLSGDDEAAIRQFLRPDVLHLLVGFQNLCMEAQPGSLMFWFDRRRIPPKEFKAMFEQINSVYLSMSQPA
jgi:hypothetical protein